MASHFFYNDDLESSADLKLYTDAAPFFFGSGSFSNDQWFASVWPNELLSMTSNTLSTALLELYLTLIACVLWGAQWSRKHCYFFHLFYLFFL